MLKAAQWPQWLIQMNPALHAAQTHRLAPSGPLHLGEYYRLHVQCIIDDDSAALRLWYERWFIDMKIGLVSGIDRQLIYQSLGCNGCNCRLLLCIDYTSSFTSWFVVLANPLLRQYFCRVHSFCWMNKNHYRPKSVMHIPGHSPPTFCSLCQGEP